ncbi:hypothetical protein KJ855_02685, partial [Patescibacteria group bacterium]|nr:hypothetical protein [Patescibacteria group bacterium]
MGSKLWFNIKSNLVIIGLVLLIPILIYLINYHFPAENTIENQSHQLSYTTSQNPGESAIDAMTNVDRIKNSDPTLKSENTFSNNKHINSISDVFSFFRPRTDTAENDWIKVTLASEEKSLSTRINLKDRASIQSHNQEEYLNMV